MTTTTTEDMSAYFDDIDGHIEMLEDEANILDDCEKLDALIERIAELKSLKRVGAKWVDNDTTASPDAWKTLMTYMDEEAREQYKIWAA